MGACKPGHWEEWSAYLLADGDVPGFSPTLLPWSSVWEHCPLEPGTVADLYLLERRWSVALAFGTDRLLPGQALAPNLNWPSTPRALGTEAPDLVIRQIEVGTPLFVGPLAAPIRQATSPLNDPLPEHGADAIGAFELGTLVNYGGLGAVPFLASKADLTVPGSTDWTAWVQDPSGMWARWASGTFADSVVVQIEDAHLYRRVYLQLVDAAGGPSAPGTDFVVATPPYTLPGHDFAGASANAGRIPNPYVRLRFGALVR